MDVRNICILKKGFLVAVKFGGQGMVHMSTLGKEIGDGLRERVGRRVVMLARSYFLLTIWADRVGQCRVVRRQRGWVFGTWLR